MKRYIVTEEQLQTAMKYSQPTQGYELYRATFDEFRAVEVPEWATHFYAENPEPGVYKRKLNIPTNAESRTECFRNEDGEG